MKDNKINTESGVQTLIENKFFKFTFEKEKSLIRFVYLPDTERMTAEEYKIHITGYVQKILALAQELSLQSNSLVGLVDMRDMKFIIDPELQEWTDCEVSAKVVHFYRKVALIYPTEFMPQVATMQLAEEEHTMQFLVAYFDSTEDAVHWLKE